MSDSTLAQAAALQSLKDIPQAAMKVYGKPIHDKRSAVDRVASKPRHWTTSEDDKLKDAVAKYGEKKWKEIALHVGNRNHTQCFQRWFKVLCPGLKKGRWSDVEDDKLMELALENLDPKSQENGQSKINWGVVAKQIPGRTAKQCRERWVNNLNPDIVRGNWSPEEDKVILQLSETFPKKWALMAKQLKGRTENAVKIRYYSLMRKRKRNSEGGGGSGSGHGSSPGKRSSSGSSSRTIKKEKISPQSAKGFSNPSGGATNGSIDLNGLSQLSATALELQQPLTQLPQNGMMPAQGSSGNATNQASNGVLSAGNLVQHAALSPQAMFLPQQLLQQQQQQQQQQMGGNQAAGNARLQIQQALMLIQQNEEQIRLLQQQTDVLKRVVQENQRLVEENNGSQSQSQSGTPGQPTAGGAVRANGSLAGQGSGGAGGSEFSGVSSVLNDNSKREKLFQLLSQYFRKHEMNAAPEEAISKVVDWTKSHGFEALNRKLQIKNGESLNEFILSIVNEQQQQRQQLANPVAQQQHQQRHHQQQQQQQQQLQQLQQQQQQLQHQQLQQQQQQQLQQQQQQQQQQKQQQQQQQPKAPSQASPSQAQRPQQAGQMGLPAALKNVQEQQQVQVQQRNGHVSPQQGGGINPAQLQQMNLQSPQGHPNFGSLPGQQLMAQQAFMHLMHQSNANAQGNQKQGNPLYAIPLSFLQQPQQQQQQQQAPGGGAGTMYARMNMAPNPNDLNMYQQQQLQFQSPNGRQNK